MCGRASPPSITPPIGRELAGGAGRCFLRGVEAAVGEATISCVLVAAKPDCALFAETQL